MISPNSRLKTISILILVVLLVVLAIDLKVLAQVSTDLPKELNPYNFIFSLIGDNVAAAAIGALGAAYLIYKQGGLKDQLDDNAKIIGGNNKLLKAIAKKVGISINEEF